METIHEIDEWCGSQCGHPLHYVEIVQAGILTEENPHYPPAIPLDVLNDNVVKKDKHAYTREPLYIE